MTTGVLAGIKVAEFAQNAAVPQCGRILAGMGADVVKIEPTAGDAMRHLARLSPNEGRGYATINPGKRAIRLDLQAPDAKEVVDGLLAWADIALVGLKGSDIERFGLDWDHAVEVNPRLVMMSLTAFGPKGPDAGQPGYDVLAQGLSGVGWQMNRSLGTAPAPTRPAMFDFGSGTMAAAAVLGALHHRNQTGEGLCADISLLGTAISLGTPIINRFEVDSERLDELATDMELLAASGADFDSQRSFYETKVVASAGAFRFYFRHYLTADGLVSVAGLSPRLFAKFHEITGLAWPPDSGNPHEPEFVALIEEAEALFATKTTAEWMELMRAKGYPCSRYNNPQQAVLDPQAEANDYVVDLDHPDFGAYRAAGMPFQYRPTKGADPHAAATAVAGRSPRLGEHTLEVLAEIGISATRIDELIHGEVVCGEVPPRS